MNEPMFSLDERPQARARLFAVSKQVAATAVASPPPTRARLLASALALWPFGARRLAPGRSTTI